ncbi:MAG: sugar transferase [Cyclobacteriaceae bacterium]
MDSLGSILSNDTDYKKIERNISFDKFILCISSRDDLFGLDRTFPNLQKTSSIRGLDMLSSLPDSERPDAIFLFGEEVNEIFLSQLQYASQVCKKYCIPLIAIIRNLEYKSDDLSNRVKSLVLKNGADDCYTKKDIDAEKVSSWIDFLALYKKVTTTSLKPQISENNSLRTPASKRAFDILVSSTLLIILSPMMLLIALIIRLESKGPVIYRSKRAGFGYKVFDFYKFRSMRTGADKELKDLAKFNQYRQENKEDIFIKIKNDPRVTRFGQFLRNTSLDELPQLVNVLIGDMSLVGNRPLPLYEADKLTKDGTAWRFLAPAGITGLWQINKRGKAEMSLDERISLDIIYARKYSLQLDLKILFSTLPAMIQKEKV